MAILDMNEELANGLVQHIGGGKTKFFEVDVLDTESITSAVQGAVAWSKETGKEIGGVIAAAGVSTPAKVCSLPSCTLALLSPIPIALFCALQALSFAFSCLLSFNRQFRPSHFSLSSDY